MPCIINVERTAKVDRHEAFARFIDFPSWKTWMPRSFRPLKGPSRPLREGDHFLVAIDFGLGLGLPSPVKVARIDTGRTITWGGGVQGVFVGEHTFFFEDAGVDTLRVRSHEEFTGMLTTRDAAAARIRKAAERIGGEQVDGLLRSFAGA